MEGPEWRGPRGAVAWSGPGGVEGRAFSVGRLILLRVLVCRLVSSPNSDSLVKGT